MLRPHLAEAETLSARPDCDLAQADWGLAPDEIDIPELRALFEYWLSKCAGGTPPSRADLDPLEIPHLLRFVYLVDVERERGKPRYRFRLIGTYVVHISGRDATGLYLDSPDYGPERSSIIPSYSDVVSHKRPRYDQRYVPNYKEGYQHYGRLVLPLVGPDGQVNMLLCGMQIRRNPDDN
ncbi:MAG: PAS domain-containing protein [Alphaproteobacteria bacterium]|nr:PAS domain-containing protein [Alphaproteobacteria bacterium]